MLIGVILIGRYRDVGERDGPACIPKPTHMPRTASHLLNWLWCGRMNKQVAMLRAGIRTRA